MSCFRRYREGEHRQVWQELVAKQLFTVEAEDVAYLTMTRVAENFEVLIERLGNSGFEFGELDDEERPPRLNNEGNRRRICLDSIVAAGLLGTGRRGESDRISPGLESRGFTAGSVLQLGLNRGLHRLFAWRPEP